MEEKEPNVPIEAKIEKAAEIMQKMGFDKKIINDLKTRIVYFDLPNKPFKVFQDYLEVHQELTEKFNFIYAVIPDNDKFRNIINFLVIPDYEEDFDYIFENYQDFYSTEGQKCELFRVLAYCYNIDRPEFSEFGSIFITKNANGKFIRIG